jgi:hypothetical protein
MTLPTVPALEHQCQCQHPPRRRRIPATRRRRSQTRCINIHPRDRHRHRRFPVNHGSEPTPPEPHQLTFESSHQAAGISHARLWVSEPLVCAAAGVALGPIGFGLLRFDPGTSPHDAAVLREVARVMLAIAVTGAAMRLTRGWITTHWGGLAVALGPGMARTGIAARFGRQSARHRGFGARAWRHGYAPLGPARLRAPGHRESGPARRSRLIARSGRSTIPQAGRWAEGEPAPASHPPTDG